MKRLLKGLGIGLLMLALVGGTVYAYVAINITAEVDVQEPISIISAAGDGTFDIETVTWDIGEIYPLDTASINVTLANAASGPITLTLATDPVSLDSGNLTFTFENTEIVVPAGGEVSFSISANTTQSLATGSYSVAIQIQR